MLDVHTRINIIDGYREVDSDEGLRYIASHLSSLVSQRPRLSLANLFANSVPNFMVQREVPKLRIRLSLGAFDGTHGRSTRARFGTMLRAIGSYQNLLCLDISRCNISDKTMRELMSENLQLNTSLTSLDMSLNAFTDSGIESLSNALRISPAKIAEINISGNMITSEGAKHVAELIRSSDSLQKLNIGSTKIGAEGVHLISAAISSMQFLEDETSIDVRVNGYVRSQISSLELSNTEMGDEGAFAIATLLRGNTLLENLNLEDNRIGRLGAKAIADVLYDSNRRLRAIDLSKNHFADCDLNEFCAMLKNNETLEELKLNQCGMDINSFNNLCMALTDSCDVSRSNIHTLEVARNGLGNDIECLIDLLQRPNCAIQKLDYGGNEVNDFGARKWANFLRNRENTQRFFHAKGEKAKFIREDCRAFSILGLKENPISSIGARYLAEAIAKNSSFSELDLRHTNIGVKGARYFKKLFFKRQGVNGSAFKLNVMKADVDGPAGINELCIGMRQDPETIRNQYREMNDHMISKIDKENDYFENEEDVEEEALPKVANIFRPHLPQFDLEFHKWNVTISGVNDEDEDELFLVNLATYTGAAFVESQRLNLSRDIRWADWAWRYAMSGYGGIIANALYRHGQILHLKAKFPDKFNVNKERNGYSFGFGGYGDFDDPVSRLSRELRRFWEVVMPQAPAISNGRTMFEVLMNQGASPLLDVLRQFVLIYPHYGQTTVFLNYRWGNSSQSIREICLRSPDLLVRRYATAKQLLLFRFSVEYPVYKSKHMEVLRVEDLLQTEEDDNDRFYFLRRFPITVGNCNTEMKSYEESAQRLMLNAQQGHRSFQNRYCTYVNPKNFKLEDILLQSVNNRLELPYMNRLFSLSNVNRLYHGGYHIFTKPYEYTLKDYLNNNVPTISTCMLIAKAVANALLVFNDRSFWTENVDLLANDLSTRKVVNQNRIHGNLKPRNIVFVNDPVPEDVDQDLFNLATEKWILTDLSRSVAHGEQYKPAYMSGYAPPEVARRMFSNDKAILTFENANEKIDVWAFGVVLYELLSGVSFFKLEKRDDSLLDDEERMELMNWLSLDQERKCLIYDRYYLDESYKLDEGLELVEWCLQGEPERRPTFEQILKHKFLNDSNTGKLKEKEDTLDRLLDKTLNIQEKWDENYKDVFIDQSHIHILNADLEETGFLVKSLSETLSKSGCRVTTDIPSTYTDDKALEHRAKSARIVLLFLSKDCFWKPSVVKQLVYAHEASASTDKNKGNRLFFLDLSMSIDLQGNAWDRHFFRDNWSTSDEFQYLIQALSNDRSFKLTEFELTSFEDEHFASWSRFFRDRIQSLIYTYTQECNFYRSTDFLVKALFRKMLQEGGLIPSCKSIVYKPAKMSDANFYDVQNMTNEKIVAIEKAKLKRFYFQPGRKERQCPPRVYVLCGDTHSLKITNAVEEIAATLERAEFTKVKTPLNNSNQLKLTPRLTKKEQWRDFIFNYDTDHGFLIIIAVLTDGLLEKYGAFLHEALKERKDQVIIIPVVFEEGDEALAFSERKIGEKIPGDVFQILQNSEKIPYFAPRLVWEHNSCLEEIVHTANYLMKSPKVFETFDLELSQPKRGRKKK